MAAYQHILWPFILYAVAVLFIVASMIVLSHFLGQRHKDHSTDETFESGIASTGSAQIRFSVKYYLIAMFFVIFDLEAVFIVAWAIAFRQLGWLGYTAIAIFIAILLLALIYEWRSGALDFTVSARKIRKEVRRLNRIENRS